ncbi:MAG TPA: PP2C family protein-serine/threonine phosphatase [Vicinamibacterales bacterium]|nr:PP2C family protein-serine/threonine phosphatase [Vicinamibacterales bacterium]
MSLLSPFVNRIQRVRAFLRDRDRQFRQTLGFMPRRSRALLGVAIFTTFTAFALSVDQLPTDTHFWLRMAVVAVYTGVLGLGYAFSSFGFRQLLPFVIAFNVLGPLAFSHWLAPGNPPHVLAAADIAGVEARLRVVRALQSVMAVTGYSCFIALLRLEGRRSVSAHTEIRLAHDIHASLAPPVSGESAALEWYGASHPSGEVGGDLVDVVSDDEAWRACIADVSGHGVAAGVFMGMFKTALRAAWRRTHDPAAALTEVNAVLEPIKQSNMFVTAAALACRVPGTFDYVLAGHPSLLHVSHASGCARWVGDAEMAIGLIDTTAYHAASFDAAPGDLVVVVTDGLIEVFDRRDHELGPDGLLPIVVAAAKRSTLQEAAADILAACARHGAQSDDQSLLLVRVR